MKFPLEDRAIKYAIRVRAFIRASGIDVRHPDANQLIRASGSVGANYVEANEAISRKDLQLRLRIARKEAREASYWLQVISTKAELNDEKRHLIKETNEIVCILSSIIEKTR